MDLNAAKYPTEALFYTDIKSYEQGAGQFISKEHNKLPALACLPLQANWFWKNSFPTTPVKNVEELVNKFIVPYNDAYCNFILNVAPNKNGLIDDNAIAALKEIGRIYKKGTNPPKLPQHPAPIVSTNIAKHVKSNSSWSDDMNLMDFANDDNFGSSWSSNPTVKTPWYELSFEKAVPCNMVVLTAGNSSAANFSLQYYANGKWNPISAKREGGRVSIFRFDRIWCEKIKVTITDFDSPPAIAELGVFNERK